MVELIPPHDVGFEYATRDKKAIAFIFKCFSYFNGAEINYWIDGTRINGTVWYQNDYGSIFKGYHVSKAVIVGDYNKLLDISKLDGANVNIKIRCYYNVREAKNGVAYSEPSSAIKIFHSNILPPLPVPDAQHTPLYEDVLNSPRGIIDSKYENYDRYNKHIDPKLIKVEDDSDLDKIIFSAQLISAENWNDYINKIKYLIDLYNPGNNYEFTYVKPGDYVTIKGYNDIRNALLTLAKYLYDTVFFGKYYFFTPASYSPFMALNIYMALYMRSHDAYKGWPIREFWIDGRESVDYIHDLDRLYIIMINYIKLYNRGYVNFKLADYNSDEDYLKGDKILTDEMLNNGHIP